MVLSQEMKDRAMKIDTGLLGHYMEKGFVDSTIQPVDDSFKILGPAFTVKITGKYTALLYYAMRRAPEGSVIVIDRGGDRELACCGEGVARVAKKLNLEGIVVDGPNTDTVGIKKLGFPVFSNGRSVATTTVTHAAGTYNVPVQCGGVTVSPGDLIFGDADGIIVVPPDEFDATLTLGESAAKREAVIFGKIETDDLRNNPIFDEIIVEEHLFRSGETIHLPTK